MRKNGLYFHIHPLTHNNQKKTDRIVWALQGMFEHGRITINSDGMKEKTGWQEVFKDEYLMFPTKNVHDDLIESLAYINQLAVTTYNLNDNQEEPEIISDICGF